ncbi:AAA family ATPase [candidate division KSB1 bacterium]|nr:AAA family ATPase [candidate division KSB1 bacterium]
MAKRTKEVPLEKLSYFCDPSQFKFQSTADLELLDDVIGQERAVSAINFGVDLKSYGYNIFALGPAGAGRTSIIKEAVEKRARTMSAPSDWCYVFNFQNPDQPNSLRLPAGKGKKMLRSMERLIDQLKKDIPEVLNSEEYKKQHQLIIQHSRETQNKLLAELDNKLKLRSFTLKKIASGLILVPIRDGQVISPEQFDALPSDEKELLEAAGQELQNELNEEFQSIHNLEFETKTKLEQHERQMMRVAIGQPMRELRQEFKDYCEVLEYFKDVEEDILEHIREFLTPTENDRRDNSTMSFATHNGLVFDRYRVNLIVDNSKTIGAPVVVENNPTYNNLIGRIDRQSKMGMLVTDYTLIKAGALHRANGGFLIIEAEQLFQNPLAWKALKRALKNRSIVITDLSEEYSFVSVKTLDPESIPLDFKVVIIGNYRAYYLLLNYDDEFQELFKVKADFNVDMPRTRQNVMSYARFIRNQCDREGLMHFDPQAISRVVVHGTKLTSDQTKLSTRFSDIHDLLIEANYWAKKSKNKLVTGEDVKKAIEASQYRLNKYETRIHETINEGRVIINTTGEAVGQVNGLSVISIGDYDFGKPSRITVQTYLGRSGIISIDREAKLTGSIYNKGVMIFTGYLNGKFGQERQISISASITFEQSYEDIEGDSASSTELYAILSSLSEFPIQQGIAVTGSVNQLGEIQPIGGVNEKIEGFFNICQAQGLTGEQGVVIPKTNVKNLILNDKVIQAVKDGKFHIYSVATVDEGIEILTGKKAGKRQKDGNFPKGTVYWAVEKKLDDMSEQLKNQERTSNKDKPDEKKEDNNSNDAGRKLISRERSDFDQLLSF